LQRLKGMLDSKRYTHSLRVMDTTVRLAGIYGADREKAAVAGLLHDCAREVPGERLLALARQHALEITKVEEALPVLLHAPVGALMARWDFGVHNIAVLRAISRHTLGGVSMSLLDKIVFVADKVEPGRRFPGVQKLRDEAEQDLDRALLRCFDMAINLSVQKGEPVHPLTVMARNQLLFAVSVSEKKLLLYEF